MAKKLFNTNNKLFLICDGTYARHQKSTNNEYQMKSYSGQKKVPLCKPFTICTTDGFIVDMLGPYLANQNDAEILKSVVEDPHGLRRFLKEGDVFVLDRGFRDVKETLEEQNFRVLKAQRQRKRVKLAKLAAKRALEENPPLPAYEPKSDPPPPLPQEKDEPVQSPPKELTLGKKIKLFRGSFCHNCLMYGVRENCFKCFERNNVQYKIPKKCRL